MNPGNVLKEIQNPNDSYPMRINDKQVNQNLAAIFSRGNLALNTKRISGGTGNYNLTNKDSVVFVDAPTGAVTLTLPQPNYWGADRSPVFLIALTNAGGWTVTIAAASGTVYGTTVLPAVALTGAIVFSDGSANYYSGAF